MISGKSCRCLLLAILLVLVVGGVAFYFVLGRGSGPSTGSSTGGQNGPLDHPELEPWIYPAPRKAKGAIASNGGPCPAIGTKILARGGNVVDALIATMLCDGVTCPHNMGLGGGFLATLYLKKEGKVVTLDARETAPAASTKDMFVNNKSLSLEGGLSVAVPAEIRGYWEMYQKYGGSVPWADLFQGTIELCETGVPVNQGLGTRFQNKKDFIMARPPLRDMYMNSNGLLPSIGDKVKLPKMAETLRIIAREPLALYNGSLTKGLVKDIKEAGGIITEEDMASYRPIWDDPIVAELSTGDKVYSSPPPGSGVILNLILKFLDNTLTEDVDSLNTTFKITEAFKFAYGIRTQLGDPKFVNDTDILNELNDAEFIESIKKKISVMNTSNDVNYYGSQYVEDDHGTANIVVYGPNGDAAAATSTINTIFGSGVVSESTGIILNNEMDDFSTPGLVNYFGVSPSEANFIAPGKRPMSSMTPCIVTDKNGDVKLVTGAAGGTRITTATALTIIRNMWYNLTTTDAVKRLRYHHQLMPMQWVYEPGFNKDVMEGMKKRGHQIKEGSHIDSCVTAISVNGDILGPSSDMRRPGNTSFLIS